MPKIKLRTRPAQHLADCKPCQARREQAMAAAQQIAAGREDPPAPTSVTWSGPLIFEGQMTGDGRYVEPNALTWENLPIPLRFVREDTGEHNGAVVVGRILSITRKPGGVIWGEGDFDTVHPDAVEAARQVREHLSNGVSADLDNVSFEIRVARELVEGPDEAPGLEDAAVDENGRVTVVDIGADDEVMDIDDARIRAATLVAVPAFEGARIHLAEDTSPADAFPPDTADTDDSATQGVTSAGDPCSCDEDADDYDPDCNCDDQDQDEDRESDPDELTAAAAPQQPPSAWFADPRLDGPTPLQVSRDGHVFGHLAVWDTCHRSFTNECVTPPRSASDYAHFRVGAVLCADGSEIPVGHITLDTFHAGKQLGAADTIAHYEHTGATVADVAAGEDRYGIWVAGALRPSVSADQVRALRSSPLSGDWRRVGGQLELVAALAVNVPGFPVPRAQGVLAASGAVKTLVASGMVPPRYDRGGRLPAGPTRVTSRTEDDISAEALAWLQKMATPAHNRARAAALHRKVTAGTLARRVANLR